MNGLLILCILIGLVLVSPVIYRQFQTREVYRFGDFDREVKEFLATAEKNGPENYYKVRNDIEDAELKASYFLFDPNGLDEISWRKLGLSPRQIKGIKNYEAKGGRFYKKEDVKKMYSIPAAQYAALEPYIRIVKKSGYKTFKSYPETRPRETYTSKNAVVMVELNMADSTQLETIRGIGPAFASRIIKFRNRMGGFHKKEQLLDVYGMDSVKYDALKDQIMVNPATVRKLNVNTATFEEIKGHPYLTYKQMNAIIQYRKQHGAYRSVDDLRKIAILNDEILRKIEPYLMY